MAIFILFKYLLVEHPVIPDKYTHRNKSPHRKYSLRYCFRIHINHLCFLQYLQFVVGDGGPLLQNLHQGKQFYNFYIIKC